MVASGLILISFPSILFHSIPFYSLVVIINLSNRTPLHCAAANNDIIIVQYLVENGACIFATTGLQHKIPALCCEKSIPGYKECVAYLEGKMFTVLGTNVYGMVWISSRLFNRF